MSDFKAIKKIIANELNYFNNHFSKVFESEDALLNKALEYLIPRKGKQIRPILVILASKLCNNITENTYFVAIAYELLHTASLIHDDVIDNADKRRNQPSLNKFMGNKNAVLVGDYLTSKSFQYIYKTKDTRQIGLLQELSSNIIRGELLQQQFSHTILKEKEYYSVIKYKTASLFATCLKSGAMSASEDSLKFEKLYKIGENLGMCFQIQDDVLDYCNNEKTGKPAFNDITEGKVTLSLLYAASKANEQEREQIIQIINSAEVRDDDKKFISDIIKKYKGIEYSHQRMDYYSNLALKELEYFQDSKYKQAIAEIIKFSSNRDF